MGSHRSHKSPSTTGPKASKRNKHKQVEEVAETEDNQQTVGNARNMWDAQVKVRNDQRKAVSSEYKHMVRDLSKRIDALAEKRRDRVQKLHQAEWNHLRFLLQQRRKVELEILRSMSAIESRSKKMIRDIVVILKAREEDLTSLNLKMNLSQA